MRSWPRHIIFTLIGLISFIGFMVMMMVATGTYIGEEFCPDDFSRRGFHYIRPNWFPLTIRGITYTNRSTPLSVSLITDGYIVPTNPATPEWDLVLDNRMPKDSTAYDARILVRYLELRDTKGSLILDDWNKKYPKHAAILWPAVARLARAGCYVEISPLMELTLQAEPPSIAKLQKQVNDAVATLPPEAVSVSSPPVNQTATPPENDKPNGIDQNSAAKQLP